MISNILKGYGMYINDVLLGFDLNIYLKVFHGDLWEGITSFLPTSIGLRMFKTNMFISLITNYR